jgi:flagellar basal body-associated protein FliL
MADNYRTETPRSGGAGRTIIIILVVAVLAVIAAVATGFLDFSSKGGALPKVAVEGGALPSVDADVGSIGVGTTNTTIEVPKVKTETETIEVPKLEVKKAN